MPLTGPAAPALKGALLLAYAAGVLAIGLGASPSFALAQPYAQAQSIPPLPSVAQASRPGASKPASANGKANGRKAATKPLWTQLTAAQQQALAPLSATWDTVSEAQKRKWLALSENFPKMPAPEQAKLQSRMSDWAALSPQQRTQARLNFGEAQQLSPDDKKAKWEAYQALSPEEKRKLAAGAAKPPATAAAVRPVTPEKMAIVPKPRQENKTPRIAVAPNLVDRNTLLPQKVPAEPPASVN